MTTTSTQDYLKAICELRGSGKRVTTGALAQHLNVAAASATNMVQRLAAAGFLDYKPRRGVVLTESGECEASAVLYRHKTIERYLVDQLGFTIAQAHAEAERLEHAASMNLVDKMSRAIQPTLHGSDGS
jgi:DtxR family Mn-dependent transcriptional regulator